MRYIKTQEELNSDGEKIPEIGDEVICVMKEEPLEFGKTYIIEHIKGNFVRQFKLKDMPFYWDSDRFELKKRMSPDVIEFYNSAAINSDANKYNL